ncbi:hypothetical protein ACIBG0_07250 [Nocardia sp. NPDC050630]|uniref:hypothetical protein n=1 Tax=Nocardia sp. NPDC050630 TaxID=3364321 RepID=UPI0037AB140B
MAVRLPRARDDSWHQPSELARVLAELRTDHQLVADILRRLTELLDSIRPDNADTLRRELDGLAAIRD